MNSKITPTSSFIRTRLFSLTSMLLFTLLVTACGEKEPNQSVVDTSNPSAQVPAAEVIIAKDAHIRAMPPGQKVTAMFLTLDNPSATTHSLIKGESNVSDSVELHEHKHENGMMKMGQVSSITIPEKGSVALASGGYHVMMIGLKKDLKVGEKVAVKLIFEDGSSQDIEPEVQKIIPKVITVYNQLLDVI